MIRSVLTDFRMRRNRAAGPLGQLERWDHMSTEDRFAKLFAAPSVRTSRDSQGHLLLQSGVAMPANHRCIGEWLVRWANEAPDQVLFAQSDGDDAQDACAQTETWFMSAVEARLEGKSKSRVRRSLRGEMGTTAAEQLVEFVFALPENMLTPEVGKAARAQCEAL